MIWARHGRGGTTSNANARSLRAPSTVHPGLDGELPVAPRACVEAGTQPRAGAVGCGLSPPLVGELERAALRARRRRFLTQSRAATRALRKNPACLVGLNWKRMGLEELKQQASADPTWRDAYAATAEGREQALPELRAIVAGFLAGESPVTEFRGALDSFSKSRQFWGFKGTVGQMFFNVLVKSANEIDLAQALRDAIPAPADEAECRQKFATFVSFVEETQERADSIGAPRPSLGSIPYFLSFFWEAQDRVQWPIYYPRSRDELTKQGLFVDKGELVERYLTLREQVFRLREELATDTWGVEAFLWHLGGERPQKQGVTRPPEPHPDDLYESYRSEKLIFADEVVTSLVLSLLTKPFVLLSGISGTGKTQLAVGLAEYLDRRAGGMAVEEVLPEGDEMNAYIRLTDPRLSRGRTSLTREHQAVFALHGLPERGGSRDYEVTLPDGTAGTMRLNNIGFTDRSRELFLLFFRSHLKQWLQENAASGDYMHLGFSEDGTIAEFNVVRPERRESGVPVQRHAIIAVRSDWTDPRGLIGYDNPLTGVYAQTDLIRLLMRAADDPDMPYVVILDEMNLARVEYYFSDFLSALELDGGTVTLRDSSATELSGDADADVPARLPLPPNVLFIGTVNIDETTHAFSPKVLDRANVLVFNEVDPQRFFEGGGEPAGSTFRLSQGSLEPADFANRSRGAAEALARGKACAPFQAALMELHKLLQRHTLHFGYRVLGEMTTYLGFALERIDGDEAKLACTVLDLQIVQKVLPKLTGGRELELPLRELFDFCHRESSAEVVEAPLGDEAEPEAVAKEVVYPRAAREIERMLKRLAETGFVSFME